MKKSKILSALFSLAVMFALANFTMVTAQQTVEDQYWDAVKNSTKVEDFQSYLKEYPNGKYAAIAGLKVGQLSGMPAQNSIPATISDYEVVQSSTTTDTPGTLGDVTVYCPGSKKVVGGGFWSNSGMEVARVWRNFAVDTDEIKPGDRGWRLDFTSVQSGQLFWVRAVCASVPPTLGYELVRADETTGATGTLGSVSAVCPGNKNVLGGGYWSVDGVEIWGVWRNRAVDTGGRQTGDRGWGLDFTSLTDGRRVFAQAICAAIPAELGYEVVQSSATTGAAGTIGSVSVVCPGNKKVLGGGYWSNSGFEVARIWRNRAVDTGGRQTGDRGWGLDFTSVQAGQLLWVRAVCASAG